MLTGLTIALAVPAAASAACPNVNKRPAQLTLREARSGENLIWGTGSRATPRSAVNAWMKSPPHRRTMLERRYRQVGVGVALGAPEGDAPRILGGAAIYTADFGYH